MAALKLLDEGLSQTDIETAKGIPTRTIRRWIKSKKVLQAKMAAKNGDTTDTEKNISTKEDKPDIKEEKPDKNMSEKDAKTDISDSTDKLDTTEAEIIAYEDGLTDGRNQGIEEAAKTSEKAAKEYVKEQDEKIKGLVEEIKRKIAESKSKPIEGTPETPDTINNNEVSPSGTEELTEEKPLWENPWVIAAGIAALGLAANMLGKNKDEAGETIIGKVLGGGKKDDGW